MMDVEFLEAWGPNEPAVLHHGAQAVLQTEPLTCSQCTEPAEPKVGYLYKGLRKAQVIPWATSNQEEEEWVANGEVGGMEWLWPG